MFTTGNSLLHQRHSSGPELKSTFGSPKSQPPLVPVYRLFLPRDESTHYGTDGKVNMMLLLGSWGKGPDCIGRRGQGSEGWGRALPSPSRKDHSSLGIDDLSVHQPNCLPTYPSDYLSARNTFSYSRYLHRGDEQQILTGLNAPTPPTPVIYCYISEDYNTRGH